MNIPALFFTISQAMLLSLVYGLFVLALLKFITKAAPRISADGRYRLFYSSLFLVFIGFLISVYKFYPASEIKPDYPEGFSSVMSMQATSSEITFKAWLELNSVWIAGFYFAGVCLQAIYLISGLFKIKRIKNQQKTGFNFVWDARFEKLCSRLEISKKVSLYFSDKILIPFTAGCIKPIVLFPVAMVNRLTVEQVESILLHELAHIKRNDYGLNILQRLMEITLFFNPFVWLISKEIRNEREFCCDDLVVKYTPNAELYASALVLLEENKRNNLQLALAATGSEKYPLLNRIKRITNMKTSNSNPKQQLLAIISVLAIGLSLAWAIPTDTTIVKKQQDHAILPNVPAAPNAPLPVAPAPPSPKNLKKPKAPVPPPSPEGSLFLAPPPPPADTNKVKKLNNAEWKKQMEQVKIAGEEMKKHFDSPEWKKQMEQMKIGGEEMKKQFDSPEWKKQMEQMKIESEKMKKQFDSPEWKKQMEQIKLESEKMKTPFDSPDPTKD